MVFANQKGLDMHTGMNRKNNCGRMVEIAKKKKLIAQRRLRKETITLLNIRKVQPNQIKPHK